MKKMKNEPRKKRPSSKPKKEKPQTLLTIRDGKRQLHPQPLLPSPGEAALDHRDRGLGVLPGVRGRGDIEDLDVAAVGGAFAVAEPAVERGPVDLGGAGAALFRRPLFLPPQIRRIERGSGRRESDQALQGLPLRVDVDASSVALTSSSAAPAASRRRQRGQPKQVEGPAGAGPAVEDDEPGLLGAEGVVDAVERGGRGGGDRGNGFAFVVADFLSSCCCFLFCGGGGSNEPGRRRRADRPPRQPVCPSAAGPSARPALHSIRREGKDVLLDDLGLGFHDAADAAVFRVGNFVDGLDDDTGVNESDSLPLPRDRGDGGGDPLPPSRGGAAERVPERGDGGLGGLVALEDDDLFFWGSFFFF